MRTLLFVLALCVERPASAHLNIPVDLYAPAGTAYTLTSQSATRTGFIPEGGYFMSRVFGYVPHDGEERLVCSFNDGQGDVACAPLQVSVYEPLYHFKTTCRATFTFNPGSRTCASTCPETPVEHSGLPKAYPNPIRAAQFDGMQFIAFPPSARMRIFSLTGRLVWEGTTDAGGNLHWHLVDRDNRLVGSGVYQVVADGPSGHASLKIAVQR